MNTRIKEYNMWVSYLNLFWSYDGMWKLWSPNISVVRNHINKEVIEPSLLEEGRLNSKSIEDDQNVYGACLNYNSGYCQWNANLSLNEKLKESDQDICDNIRKGFHMIKPMNRDIVLFHGLEPGLNYGLDTWKIGHRYTFPFFLSKTLSWKVATFFAWLSSKSLYQQRYLLCKYPPGSKHICLDVRKQHNDEYEFLSIDETFKYTEKIYHISLLPRPTLRTYYVMESN